MSIVRNENYYVVQGFMINELGLKGNELTIYAIIYGFSQAEGQFFTGGQQYLADWTNSTTRGVRKALNSLCEKGLLEKRERINKKGKFIDYRALRLEEQSSARGAEQSSATYGGVEEQSSARGAEQSSDNNIYINNINKNNILKKSKKESSTPKDIVNLFNDTCVSLPSVKILTEKRIKIINARLKAYTISDIQKAFSMAEASKFLTGQNDRSWKADFDWLMNENNMVKVLEGKYINSESKSKPRDSRRDEQYKALEQRLINFGSSD